MAEALRDLLARFARGAVSADDALRAVLAHPSWRVAHDEQGEPEVVELDDGTALVVAVSAGEGRALDGCTLVRQLAPAVGGVVIDPDEPWGRVFRPEQLPGLQCWARAVELERAIERPGPGQAALLFQGPWWVAVAPGTTDPAVVRQDGLDVVTLLTAPDAVATFRRTEPHRRLEVAELGPELWEGLARRTDYDGLRLNPLRPLARVWPPHLPASLVAGADPRPGAAPLPARTVAEIHLWLDQQGARPDRRRIDARGPVAVCEAWFGYDRREIPFEAVAPTPDPEALGPGKTRILCAGLLVRQARGALAGLPDDLSSVDPRRLDASQRQRAARAARWLAEVEKLVEDGVVPFSALRTPEGAHLWRVEPDLFTAESLRGGRWITGR
jgi:hypothetical protein